MKIRRHNSRRNTNSELEMLRERVDPLLYSGDPEKVEQAFHIYLSLGYKQPDKLLPLDMQRLKNSAGSSYTEFIAVLDKDLSFCDFSGQEIIIYNDEQNFAGCNFNYSRVINLFPKKHTAKMFAGSTFIDAEVNFSQFSGSNFDGCTIKAKHPYGTNEKIMRCSFRGAKILGWYEFVVFVQCNFQNAQFLAKQLKAVIFNSCSLRGSNWENIVLNGVTVDRSCITEGISIKNVETVEGRTGSIFPSRIESEPMKSLVENQSREIDWSSLWPSTPTSRKNPIKSAPPNFAIAVYSHYIPQTRVSGIGIALLAGNRLNLENLLGFIQLNVYGSEYASHIGVSEVEIFRAIAKKGYGPLLYDTAAKFLRRPLVPSGILSDQAEAFWEKQPGGKIKPLSHREAVAKYGTYPWGNVPVYSLSEKQVMALEDVFCEVYGRTGQDGLVWGRGYEASGEHMQDISPLMSARKGLKL